MIALLSGVSACRRERREPRRTVARTTPPSLPGNGHILLLPDSAIVAKPGSIEERLARFLASRAPAPRTFRFDGAEFAPWASTPNPQTLGTMYSLVQILRAYPNATVLLTGYTDNVGTDTQNRALATERVRHLATLLVQGGVRADRITTLGKGATDFVADNATEAGRARNRRVELTVTGI